MASPFTLGQFLMAEDLRQAAVIAYNLPKLEEHDKQVVQRVLEDNWNDEEQMVSNLLQYPHLIPEEMRFKTLLRGLRDAEHPYFTLSAIVGIQKLRLSESEWKMLSDELKKAVLHDQGVIAMRAFLVLYGYLKHPTDTNFVFSTLKSTRSPLMQNVMAWLVRNVHDRKEIVRLLQEASLEEEVKNELQKGIGEYFDGMSKGEERPLGLETFDYVPNLDDFEAMLDKQETLSDFFQDLDTDKDGRLSAEEVKTFLEDIGKDVSVEEVQKEMNVAGTDKNGKLDRDGFIEMMFPRFQMQ